MKSSTNLILGICLSLCTAAYVGAGSMPRRVVQQACQAACIQAYKVIPATVDVGSPVLWYSLSGSDTNSAGNPIDLVAGVVLTNYSCTAGSANGKAAFYFDGTNSYMQTKMGSYGAISNKGCVCAWVWPRNSASREGIASRWDTAAPGARSYLLITEGNPEQVTDYLVQSDGTSISETTVASIPTGAWTHVAMLANGTKVIIYTNGVAFGTGQSYNNTISTQATAFCVGKLRPDIQSYLMQGYIRDIRVFTNLTATQLTNVYQSTL